MQSTDAIIAKRTDDGTPDTDEIRALADAAGYDPVGEVVQNRPEDVAYQFGRGKADTLAERVAQTGAGAVVFDNQLSPTQTRNLAERCPDGTAVLDRYRLVLDIFEEQAESKRAKLQVERARLKYDLPRVREAVTDRLAGEDLAHDEKGGKRVLDVERRIDEIDRKLSDLGDDAVDRRKRRREEGFEFVALVGYTNAGKSTLMHRLADDLDFGDRDATHADLDGTAEIEDRLFQTLDTTTRRATVRGRRTLVTDTVGFIDDLPHEAVASFHGTLSETEYADCVVLVADASDAPAELRRKLRTSYDLLDGSHAGVVTVLNKADLLDDAELSAREEAIADFASDPIAVSATDGEGLDALRDRVAGVLPERRSAALTLPNDDEAMSLVSWLYDRANVENVSYDDDAVRVEFTGRPSVVERAKAKADALSVEG